MAIVAIIVGSESNKHILVEGRFAENSINSDQVGISPKFYLVRA